MNEQPSKESSIEIMDTILKTNSSKEALAADNLRFVQPGKEASIEEVLDDFNLKAFMGDEEEKDLLVQNIFTYDNLNLGLRFSKGQEVEFLFKNVQESEILMRCSAGDSNSPITCLFFMHLYEEVLQTYILQNGRIYGA
jgi:hypothetical protein